MDEIYEVSIYTIPADEYTTYVHFEFKKICEMFEFIDNAVNHGQDNMEIAIRKVRVANIKNDEE